MIYYSYCKPHNSRARNYIEIWNETLIMFANYHMICFSEFNLNLEAQYQMGYSFIVLFIILVFTNIMVIVNKSYKSYVRNKELRKIRGAKISVAVARMKLNQKDYAK